jgi:hypothetical protein
MPTLFAVELDDVVLLVAERLGLFLGEPVGDRS